MDQPTRTRRPVLLILIGAALIVVAIFVLLLNSPQQTAILPSATFPAEYSYPEIPRVSPADARKAFDAKTAVFVDARASISYDAGHIPGALNIPENQLADRLVELKKTDWIITYCT